MSGDNSEIGKALLVIGGVVLGGIIISSLMEEDDSTRENHPQDKDKKSTEPDKSYSKSEIRKRVEEKLRIKNQILDSPERPVRFVVEVSPKPGGISQGGNQTLPAQNYPPFYYTLSKSQQYKYRQKLKRDKRITEL